jgi:3-deoxy-manno-octulosonate cytidylyltransferase (CMP-KDO synthetase)
MAKTFVLIPARMESSRLPNKPLKLIGGLPMVVMIAKRAMEAKNVTTVVCTDSAEIIYACSRHSILTCNTSDKHKNGTERIAEAANIMSISEEDIIIDVQGDEPFVTPSQIHAVRDFLSDSAYKCIVPYQLMNEYQNLNRVKIVNNNSDVLYFSRADVPVIFSDAPKPLKKHLSIIGFKKSALEYYLHTSPTKLENLEQIELMRLIENKVPVGTFELPGLSLSVDTREDYEKARRMMENDDLYHEMNSNGALNG